jgi:polysaccharide export outer membrane protein
MQDLDSNKDYSSKFDLYLVKVDDILKIDVNAETPETALIFNPNALNPNFNKDALIYNGYQVNSDGFINFPSLGKIKVEGKNIDEIRDYIYTTIRDKGVLVDPSVDVKLLNTHFIVLGEVNSPGRYEYIKNNLNLLEAIGMASDLTINGKRDDIKIIRTINGMRSVRSVDLTKSDFLNSKSFQIMSGDIIIVNPNKTKVKQAGIIGNSGTLLSLLSFILSSIIVISN